MFSAMPFRGLAAGHYLDEGNEDAWHPVRIHIAIHFQRVIERFEDREMRTVDADGDEKIDQRNG